MHTNSHAHLHTHSFPLYSVLTPPCRAVLDVDSIHELVDTCALHPRRLLAKVEDFWVAGRRFDSTFDVFIQLFVCFNVLIWFVCIVLYRLLEKVEDLWVAGRRFDSK
jgi:hypothetical protein